MARRRFIFQPQVVQCILEEAECDAAVLQTYVQQAVYAINNPNEMSSQETVEQYLALVYAGVNHPNCPSTIYAQLIQCDHHVIQQMVVDSYRCPEEVLERVVAEKNLHSGLFYEAIANPNLTMQTILSHVSVDILREHAVVHGHAAERLAHDNTCPPEILRVLVRVHATHPKYAKYLIGVARNPSCPPDVLDILLSKAERLPVNDPNRVQRTIYAAIIANPNCTNDQKALIALSA